MIHYINDITIYPYDAGTYWDLGYQFGVNKFSFTNYSYGLRGYLLPFLHYILIKLASIGIGTERINLWIFHSILYTFTFFILFPRLIEKWFNRKIDYKVRGIFIFICMYFFKGLILYPLSDLPAFTFFLIAFYLFVLLLEEKQSYSILVKSLYGIIIGIFLAGAYYVRPVYLIGIVGFMIVAGYFMIRKKKYVLLYSLIGMIMIAVPQVMINHIHFHTYSPLIQTETAYKGKSLYLQQLNWGIMVQKYETNLDLQTYESPSMSFEDKVGQKLLNKNGIFTGYYNYIKFVILHIGDVGCIYLKHLFNGLDITYNDAYIYNLNKNRFFIQLFNYTFIFLGIKGSVFYFRKKYWNVEKIAILVLYFLPILLVIPTAVETRFFIGLHMLLYFLGCMVLMDSNWKELIHKNKIKKFIAYIIFLAICFLLNSQTFNCFGISLW